MVDVRAGEVLAESPRRALDLGEIEGVHDIRVATRRLRAAMEMFRPCFPRKRFRRAKKRLKALADALGERRDRDVAVEFLGGFLEGAPAGDRDRLEIAIARLREEQRDANEALAPLLTEGSLGKLRESLTALAQGARGDEPLQPGAARIVAARLEELRDLSDRALEPGAESAQHEMRIAAKRLRYVLEVVGDCFGPEGEAVRLLAKELQGVLGEIHDCDVMLPRVAGIESVEALLRTRRELLYRRFVELWKSDDAQGAFERLCRLLIAEGAVADTDAAGRD